MRPTRSFKNLWYTGVLLAATGPLGLWAPDLHPPWPDFIVPFAMLGTAIAAILGLLAGRAIKRTVLRSSAGSVLLIVGLVCLFAYGFAYSDTVVVEEQPIADGGINRLRFVIGDELRPNIEPDDDLELLRDHSYEPAAIWTRETLTRNRMRLILTFLLTFGSFTAGLALIAGGAPSGKS